MKNNMPTEPEGNSAPDMIVIEICIGPKDKPGTQPAPTTAEERRDRKIAEIAAGMAIDELGRLVMFEPSKGDKYGKAFTKLFHPGTFYITAGTREAFPPKFVFASFSEHTSGNWGKLSAGDRAANDEAVKSGDRILSSYEFEGKKLWLITEADRSSTTALCPDEY